MGIDGCSGTILACCLYNLEGSTVLGSLVSGRNYHELPLFLLSMNAGYVYLLRTVFHILTCLHIYFLPTLEDKYSH